MKNVVFDHVMKAYDKSVIVKDLDMGIRKGECLILLGSFDYGESTTPWMIVDLERLSGRNPYMGDHLVNDVPCGERNVSMVSQNYALFPHIAMQSNTVYGLGAHKVDLAEMGTRLSEVPDMLDLKGSEERRPEDPSGGQRQGMALARAVVKHPDYFLLGESLSNPDARLGLRARKGLVRIHEIYHQTLVYVARDQIEAMAVGQHIALIREGKMQTLDTPTNTYNRPTNVFTTEFIRSPSMSIVEASYTRGALMVGRRVVWLPDMWSGLTPRSEPGRLFLGACPRHVILHRRCQENTLEGTVRYMKDYGNRYGMYVQVNNMEIIVISEGDVSTPGESVYTQPGSDRVRLSDKATQMSPGYPEQLRAAEESCIFQKGASRKGENSRGFAYQCQCV